MKTLVSLLLCLAVAQAGIISYNDKSLWEQFKLNHKKVYSNSEEHEFRFKIFLDNLRKITEHNREYEAGTASYKMGINQFTDLLPSEFAEKFLVRPKEVQDSEVERQALPMVADLPESVDWREKGAVTGVKDQGQCGGCWAFAATGAMEGACFLASQKLVSLSEQNLIDCSDRSYGNSGCNGGLEYNGWDYVIDNHGLDTEDAYPYEARNGKCHFDASKVGCTLSSYKHLPKNDEAQLQNAVATVGPISIGIDASFKFQMYAGGVFQDNTCSSKRLNHSVLAVGYGVENGKEFWLVKNSWGTTFGEDGYIKMARNQNNMCGVAADASYPIV